jgi:chromosome segregation ATPase
MENGVIDSLLDKSKIESEIKSLIEGLENAQEAIRVFGETSNSTFAELVNSIKKMKEAVNFTELTASIKEYTKAQRELDKVNKEHQTQQQKVDALTKQLIERNHELAVTEQKVRLQIAEKNREAKNEAQQQLSLEKISRGYLDSLKQQATSIKELTEQNKQLRQIRDTMDTSTQSEEIKQLNALIDTNTAVIRLNEDAYVQQKMNIGNYQSALDGLKQQLLDASAALQKMAAQGDTQSEAYKEQQAALVSITAQIENFKNEMLAAANDVEPMQTQLKKLKQEAQELYSAIKNGTATEDMAARFHEVTEEAADLQKKYRAFRHGLIC